MNMSKIKFLRRLTLCITFFVAVFVGIVSYNRIDSSNDIIGRIVNADLLSENRYGVEYLNSFNNADLVITDNKINYSSEKLVKDFYEIEYLSDFNSAYYTVSFEVTYIKLLDLLFLDILLQNHLGDVIEQENFFGYVTVDENGNIYFSMGAHTVYIKRDSSNTSQYIDYNNNNYYLSSKTSIYTMIDSNYSNATKQFIAGLVIKK
jgi:hypothetical protein